MRRLVLLSAVWLAASPCSAQSPMLCGAPDGMTPERAETLLTALVVEAPWVEHDPHETADEWYARRLRMASDARQAALDALGPYRTLRIGVAARLDYDADEGTLWFGGDSMMPRMPYWLNLTQTLAFEVRWDARPARATWGTRETARQSPFSGPFAGRFVDPFAERRWSVPFPPARARAFDIPYRDACRFVVLRVLEREPLLVRVTRVEAAVVVDGEPHVWGWTVQDDEQVSLDLSYGPPPVPPPPPDDSGGASNVFDVVEQEPVLIGGLEDLAQRLQYPEFARRANIEGTVFVQFIVDERGNVTDAVVARSPNDALSEEALRVVYASRFVPGRSRGRPVKVRYTLPVRFTLP